jgi:NDP-sugar pyrophosphorylase family protein
MHKDCIILAHHLIGDDGSTTTESLHKLLSHLKQFHICKIVYHVHSENKDLQDWILRERKAYGFAIDIELSTKAHTLTNADVAQLLLHSDSNDVVMINGNCRASLDLDAMIALQQQRECDITIASMQEGTAYNSSNFSGGLVLFKPSYLSLNLTADEGFESSYLTMLEVHSHQLSVMSPATP